MQALDGGVSTGAAPGATHEAVFDINGVFAGILLLTAFALALDGVAVALETRLRWSGSREAGETERL